MGRRLVTLVLFCFSFNLANGENFCQENNPDAAMQPGTSGEEITRNVIARIEQSNIFPSDEGMLLRLAAVVTNFGTDPIEPGFYGGIWKITEAEFRKTITPTDKDGERCLFLASQLKKIKDKLGIDLLSLEWKDLTCPLVSGLVARLKLARESKPVELKEFSKEQEEFCELYCDVLTELYSEEGSCGEGTEELPDREDLKGQAKFFKEHFNDTEDFLEKSGIKGDPHLTQLVPGTANNSHLICYDVTGNDGDIFNFVHEPTRDNLKLMAKLTGRSGAKKAMYIGEMKLSTVSSKIRVDVAGTYIDSQHYGWQKEAISLGQVTVHINSHSVRIIMGFVVITVDLRHGHHEGDFLNLNIQHVGRLPENTKGILGSIARNVQVVEAKSSLRVLETNALYPLELKGNCWHLSKDLEADAPDFNKLLLAQCTNCAIKWTSSSTKGRNPNEYNDLL